MTRLLTLLRLSRLFSRGGGDDKIAQPIALTKADGTVFTTALGAILVRGTSRVRPIPTSAFRNGVWYDSGYWDDAQNWRDS